MVDVPATARGMKAGVEMKKMNKATIKRAVLLGCGVLILILIPILGAVSEEDERVEFDVIASAADEYLNRSDVTFNIPASDLLLQMLQDDPFIVDIRAPQDYAKGHIPGAVSMPMASIFDQEMLAALPQEEKIYVYCYTGHAASRVAAMLNMLGYDATNLKWGISSWTTDFEVAPYRFYPESDAMDYPVQTEVNLSVDTYSLLTLDYTPSNDKWEIIQAACEAYASGDHPDIKATELYKLLNDANLGNDPLIVSLRSPRDYLKGHIPGAINIPLEEIAKKGNLPELPRDRLVVVYYHTGHTGSQVAAILGTLGYNVANLHWGMTSWTQDEDIAPGRFDPQEDAHNYPVETGVAAAPSGGGAGGGGGPCG